MAVSSGVSVAPVEPAAVVFWTNVGLDRNATVQLWGAPASGPVVQCHTSTLGSTYTTPPWYWEVVPDSSENTLAFHADAIAVSPWVASSSSALSMAIAVVVRTTTVATGAASLALQALFPTVSSVTVATTAGFFPLSMLSTPPNAACDLGVGGVQVVGATHLRSSLTTTLHGAFLVAYNTPANPASPCGGVFVTAGDGTLQNWATVSLCSGLGDGATHTGGLLSMASSYATPTAPVLFLLFADAPATVLSVRLVAGSGSQRVLLANVATYAYLPVGALTSLLSVSFTSSTNPPQLLGLANGIACDALAPAGSLTSNCIVAADTAERVFLAVQGMPFGSSPSAIAGAAVATGTLVASTPSGVYTLSAGYCSGGGQYWTGSQCVSQRCLRRVPCAFGETSDGTACQCMPGFYRVSGSCVACAAGPYYCSGGDTPTACGSGLRTLTGGANSSLQCLCQSTGTYNNPAITSGCTPCTVDTTSYCPDQWSIQSCPPHADAASMSASLGTTTPAYCACLGGYYGPGCTACPSGMACPHNAQATNVARLFVVVTQAGGGVGAAGAQALVAAVLSVLQTYYSGPGFPPTALH